mgnify:CR=1 FL=1
MWGLVFFDLMFCYLLGIILLKANVDYNEIIDIFDVLLITDISTN